MADYDDFDENGPIQFYEVDFMVRHAADTLVDEIMLHLKGVGDVSADTESS